ncbi:MAG: type VI secretion system baseplate subunit TssG [Gammaproteobacteria bacterium]|nr:type VI secretion system baseplate subunit TssG [Gammaproteobacteria bacterium]MDH5802711.1 type VI secretion system baseplate subunit TssG [Gammaproteobacteria bacterium]
MASKSRSASHPLAVLQSLKESTLALLNAIKEAPYKYGFFQAVRRLECAYSDKPLIGQSLRPKDDPVRFQQPPSLAFAPSTLSQFSLGEKGRPPKLSINFFGLFGPQGPLPLHLTEYAYDRALNSSDTTFAGFADMFHHRMISLYYRAWANTQPTVSYDRPQADRFSAYVGSIMGFGLTSLRNREELPDRVKLFYAGLLASQTRNASNLQAMISSFFQVNARIEQFVGQWMELPKECRMLLGITRETCTLGVNAAVGNKAWESQQKFRIVLGPLSKEEYLRMLPGGESIKRLQTLVRAYVGDEFDWDMQLIMKKESMPMFRLGINGDLGWTTRVWSRTIERDVDRLIIHPGKIRK